LGGEVGGLTVVVILIGYSIATVWIVKRVKGAAIRVIALGLAVLIPTADAVIGRIQLKRMCSMEGGLRVSRVVEGVEGFLDSSDRTGYWVERHGYRFTETNVQAGGLVDRVAWVSGKPSWERGVPMSSLYRYRDWTRTKAGRFEKHEYAVEVIASGEVLSRNTDFRFVGGWAERFLSGFSDAGAGTVAGCDVPPPDKMRIQTVTMTLKPTSKGE
jgi:hypothetical protein